MTHHGGFGAALQVRQHTLQDILTVQHRGGSLTDRVELTQSVNDVDGGGAAQLVLDWWVDAPRVELNPTNGGFALVRVRCVGDLTIFADSIEPDRLLVRVELVVRTTMNGELAQRADGGFGIDASFLPIAVIDSHIRVLGGGFMPLAWRAWFSSEEFRAAVGLALAFSAANVPLELPADLNQLFEALSIGAGTTATVTGIVGPEVATFGVDFVNASFSVATSGDPAAVTPFHSVSDLALILDEAVAPLVAHRLRVELNDQVAADVTAAQLSFESGHLHVSGTAEVGAGSADFRFDATPMLGRPEWVEIVDDEYSQSTIVHPATDEIWLDLTNVDLEASLSWWVGLTIAGGVVFLGPGVTPLGAATVFAQIVNGILVGLQKQLVAQTEARGLIDRTREITLAGVDELPFRFHVTSLQVFSNRVQSRAKLRPLDQSLGRIDGTTWIDADQFLDAYDYRLLGHPLHFHPDDPELRVRWQVRRLDTNEVVATVERPPGHPDAFTFRAYFLAWGAGKAGIEHFNVAARVYRVVRGVTTLDYWNTSTDVRIEDRLDRSRPYTRWRHEVVTPKVVVHPDGTHERVGKNVFIRDSKIHRTDIPGRCRFASRVTLDVPRPEALEELPFELDELAAHRAEVCDYCFYGGPDKTEPLVGRGKVAPIGGGSTPAP